FDSGEQINSLADFNNVDNQEILEGTTKTYSQATLHYLGKSAIPKVRGAFMLRGGYKGFALDAQFLYSFGGYAYDGAYARLMGNDGGGNNNGRGDIGNGWARGGDVTDVTRL